MTGCDHPVPAGLRTVEISVPGANCSSCFNEAMDKVRGLDGVTDVRASISSECIAVQHDGLPLALLVNTLRTYLHGADDSSHECQMVAVEPDVVTMECGCARSTATPHDRPEPD